MSKKNKHDWKKVVKQEQSYICPVCGKRGTDKSLDIHHKRPKSKNGSNTRNNLVAWHKVPCHQEYHQNYGLQTSNDYGNPI